MIDYIRGRLVKLNPGEVVLEVGGAGIRINVPLCAESASTGSPGNQATYYTRLVFKEDELVLYGFETPVERDFFNLVTGVSGFGPKLALSMLGMLSVSQIYWAILGEDIPLLCQVPGVGKKISQRLILELKDKLPKFISTEAIERPAEDEKRSRLEKDLAEALLSLGYSKFEVAAALNRVHRESTEQISKEEALRRALQSLGGR